MKPRGSTKSFHSSLNLMPGHPRGTLEWAAEEAIVFVWATGRAGICFNETRGADEDEKEVKLAQAARDKDGS